MTNDLPADALGMGNPVAEYQLGNKRAWYTGIFFGVVGLGLFAIAAFVSVVGESNPRGALFLGACFGIPGLLCLCGAAWQLYSAFKNQKRRVVVFETGLARVGASKNAVIRWDDINTVFQALTDLRRNGTRVSTIHTYTICLKDNSKVLFDDTVQNVEALGNTIQKEVSNRLLPRYMETYTSGRTVTFGRLTISQAGINNSRETMPWDQVEAVNIDRGQISVRKQGKWFNWAGQTAAQTPNLLIFLTMIDQIVGINQKKK